MPFAVFLCSLLMLGCGDTKFTSAPESKEETQEADVEPRVEMNSKNLEVDPRTVQEDPNDIDIDPGEVTLPAVDLKVNKMPGGNLSDSTLKILKGENIQLSWTVKHADICDLTQDGVSLVEDAKSPHNMTINEYGRFKFEIICTDAKNNAADDNVFVLSEVAGVDAIKVGINYEDSVDGDYNDIVMCFTAKLKLSGNSIKSAVNQTVTAKVTRSSAYNHYVYITVIDELGASQSVWEGFSSTQPSLSFSFPRGSRLHLVAKNHSQYGVAINVLNTGRFQVLKDVCR